MHAQVALEPADETISLVNPAVAGLRTKGHIDGKLNLTQEERTASLDYSENTTFRGEGKFSLAFVSSAFVFDGEVRQESSRRKAATGVSKLNDTIVDLNLATKDATWTFGLNAFHRRRSVKDTDRFSHTSKLTFGTARKFLGFVNFAGAIGMGHNKQFETRDGYWPERTVGIGYTIGPFNLDLGWVHSPRVRKKSIGKSDRNHHPETDIYLATLGFKLLFTRVTGQFKYHREKETSPNSAEYVRKTLEAGFNMPMLFPGIKFGAYGTYGKAYVHPANTDNKTESVIISASASLIMGL